MTHLTNEEFVDFIDGTLTTARVGHVHACEECRERAEGIRDALIRVAAADAGEPSPLFWDHFSANVRQAIDGIASPEPRWGSWLRPAVLVPIAAALIAGITVSLWPVAAPTNAPDVSAGVRLTTPAQDGAPESGIHGLLHDVEDDEAWALVRTVADDVPWDDTHDAGISARPDAAERMALELSDRERFELARLLHDELRRAGA
jgi:hypothetical protein